MIITRQDTNGTKPLLNKGEFGYDDYVTGGDAGRVYVGTGTENIPLANKDEITSAVSNAVAALVDSAPNTLDTLNDFALALGNDENFAATTASAIGSKIPKVSTPVLNAVPRVTADGTLQNSGVIIDDNSNVVVPGSSSGTNGGAFVLVRNGASSNIGIGNYSALNGGAYDATSTLWCNGGLNITDNTTSRMRIDTNGNVGLCVTPSAWHSSIKALEIGGIGVYACSGTAVNYSTNCYYNGVWRYTNNAPATNHTQDNGMYTWYTAPSGTAGNPITWATAMTLDAGGVLNINSTTTNGRINIGASSNYVYGDTSGNLLLGAGNTTRLTMKSTGNVLIGTETDNGVDKLQVNGSIKTNFGVNTFEGRTPYIGANTSWSIMVKDPNYVYFTNLNDVIKSGRYNCQGSEVSNCPDVNEWWYIDVMSHSNREDSTAWIQQIAYPMGTTGAYAIGTFFIRLKKSGIWSAWVQK